MKNKHKKILAEILPVDEFVVKVCKKTKDGSYYAVAEDDYYVYYVKFALGVSDDIILLGYDYEEKKAWG
jgi:hypothetical protein